MQEIGPDLALRASREAEGMPIVVASTSPLRLVRHADDGDEHRSFSDFLAMVPRDAQLPAEPEREPPSIEGKVEDDDDGDDELEIAFPKPEDNPGNVLVPRLGEGGAVTVGQCVDLLVKAHRDGVQSFYNVDTEFTIKVPMRLRVLASNQEAAEAAIRKLQDSPVDEEATQVMDFDPAEVLGRSITALRHAPSLDIAGWTLEAQKIAKLSDEEMRVLARAMISKTLMQYEAEAAAHASVLRRAMGRG